MPKFSCKIGFAVQAEKTPGVWIDEIRQKTYRAELIRNARQLQSTGQVNEDIKISNEISIIADPYARMNFHAMRYAEFMGTRWSITSVDVQYPRLNLTLGGVYNGQQASTADDA